jgi:outer membrane protein assembly factor BamB
VSLPNANPWSTLGLQQIVANGTIYIWTLGGNVYSINILTGAINWQYQTPSSATSPYGIEPLWESTGRGVVAGGLLILGEGHEFAPPLFAGANQLALNVTNGQPVWSILGFFVNGDKAVSDGILTDLNAYDNQIYAFGMGPSATTVSAPDIGVTTSTPITITGTVMDISAGSQQQAVAANFPHGLPCVSDASMSAFMEAVYMQQPMPTNITGVPVTISVVDANGNNRVIGTTTTNANGFFSFNWKPDITGNYTVTATFAGSQSYYGSRANTAFYASASAPTSAPTATPLTGLASNATLMYGLIAMIIVIIVIGVVLALLVVSRERP